MENRNYLQKAVLVGTLLATGFAATLAQAGGHRKSCCPKCSTPCELKVEEGTESKYCWNVESKTVCIPRVRFSWQWPGQKKKSCCSTGQCDTGCDGNCGKQSCLPSLQGRSREVCVLVKHEYECPKCKYTWAPKEKEDCCKLETEGAAQASTAGSTSTSKSTAKLPANLLAKPIQQPAPPKVIVDKRVQPLLNGSATTRVAEQSTAIQK